MNLETQLSFAAILFGVLSVILSVICYRKLRAQRGLLEFVGKQVEDLEDVLAKNKELLETNAQRVGEQSRRIAWLETRIRQPKQASEEIVGEPDTNESPKMNMTERRHRVITLATRGQNAEAIATTLGMLPGEVELIINLNFAGQNKK
jgi:DNA-binding NarL/FixJ family response regulator